MLISEILNIVEGEQVLGKRESLENRVEYAFACDLMSEILALYDFHHNGILITGLTNPQSIRTADILDIDYILFVRGKVPSKEMIELGKETGIELYRTEKPMFETCGRLYNGGLKGIS